MGKIIDGFVLHAAFACGLYFILQQHIANRAVCIAMALLGWLLFRRLFRRLFAFLARSKWLKMRNMRRKSRSAMMQLACLPDAELHEAVVRLIQAVYAVECGIEVVQLPPTAHLSQERLFSLWRSHAGEEKLLLCTTGQMAEECRNLASALHCPRLALLDGHQLVQLASEHPGYLQFSGEKKNDSGNRLRFAKCLLFNRKNAPRCLLCSGSMLLMYVMTDSFFYCASALILLLVALISLRSTARPQRLF